MKTYKLEKIREIRNIMNNFLLDVLVSSNIYYSIKEGKAGYGTIYVYDYDHEAEHKNNSKKKALKYIDYIHCHSNDATLLKNQNEALIEIINDCVMMVNVQLHAYNQIIEQFHYNDRDQDCIEYLEQLINIYNSVY